MSRSRKINQFVRGFAWGASALVLGGIVFASLNADNKNTDTLNLNAVNTMVLFETSLVKPTGTVEGMDLELKTAKDKSGEERVYLVATNINDQARKITPSLQVTRGGQSSPMSRVIRIPEVLKRQELIVEVEPGETRMMLLPVSIEKSRKTVALTLGKTTLSLDVVDAEQLQAAK